MRSFSIKAMQTDRPDEGRLKIHVTAASGGTPISGARITVSYTGEPDRQLEEVTTDSSGNTEELELAAPPLEYSIEPSEEQPYSEYTLSITAPGFEPVEVVGAEILPEVTALQEIQMIPEQGEEYERFVIPAHTLFGDYPPKIAEAEIKPTNETGEIVLSRVVVPEFVIVHDGVPTDSTAVNYWVRYRDYIKNVASSEIYATWTDAAIRANVLAIMSFTLNRVYTEWYRNKGYDFTITMQEMKIGPLCAEWTYRYTASEDAYSMELDYQIILKDGSSPLSFDVAHSRDNCTRGVSSFTTPLDLTQVDYILIGDPEMGEPVKVYLPQ